MAAQRLLVRSSRAKQQQHSPKHNPPTPSPQMSLTTAASPLHCAAKKRLRCQKLDKRLVSALSTLISTILFLSLLIWLILRPSKPEFSLLDTALYDLSLSSSPPPRLLNSTVQATVVSRNPNARVGVYYDRLLARVVYKGEQITAESALPPFYQGHGDINLISASLAGASVPVSPSLGYEVVRDQTSGRLLLRLRLDGQLRWKVGGWVSRRYRFDVDCVAVVVFAPGEAATVLAGSVRSAQCSTNV